MDETYDYGDLVSHEESDVFSLDEIERLKSLPCPNIGPTVRVWLNLTQEGQQKLRGDE